MVRWVTGKMSAVKRDTAGDHHRVIDQAETESSENTRAQERCHREAKGRKVKFEEAFPIQEVYRGDPKEGTSHMNVSLLWAVLDCGAAKSLAGAESAAMLAQACEKRGRKAGDDRKVEAVEEKYHCRGIGAQQKTSFIRLQVPRTLGGQNVHHARNIFDGTTASLVGNDHLLPSVSR